MERIALITGASSGIGAATARRLARTGFVVYGAARRLDRLADLAADGVRPLALDVTSEESMVAAVDQVLAESGRIDVLVNNAGYGAIEDMPMAEARRQIEVNLFGLARMIQLVLPTMRGQGSGVVVNVSSMGGKFTMPFGGWYHASKFAVEGFSDVLRGEVAPLGIDVVVVEPGNIATEWGGIAMDSARSISGHGGYAERIDALAAAMDGPVARFGSDPDVVAKAIERAVTARRPRTRYAVGSMAKPILLARKVLPDRAMDWLQAKVVG